MKTDIEKTDDLQASICPNRRGWKWSVEGDDVPIGFMDGRYNPSGVTMTLWGAKRKARRSLKQIRQGRAKDGVTIYE